MYKTINITWGLFIIYDIKILKLLNEFILYLKMGKIKMQWF